MAEKLAIDGGTAVLTRKDYGNWPVITDDDREKAVKMIHIARMQFPQLKRKQFSTVCIAVDRFYL